VKSQPASVRSTSEGTIVPSAIFALVIASLAIVKTPVLLIVASPDTACPSPSFEALPMMISPLGKSISVGSPEKPVMLCLIIDDVYCDPREIHVPATLILACVLVLTFAVIVAKSPVTTVPVPTSTTKALKASTLTPECVS
jgi:hypothetical protein